jgi:hypothetical protein
MKKITAGAASAVTALTLLVGNVQAQTQILPDNDDIEAGGNFTIASLIASLINGAILISALAVLLYLILGGFQWLTSGGDKGKTEAARNKITAALIGLLIVLASWAIYNLILSFFGIDLEDVAGGIGLEGN